MNIFKPKTILLLSLLPMALLFTAVRRSDSTQKNEVLIKLLLQSLNTDHYAPLPIDDDFSKKAFKSYIQRLDFYKKFLLKEDYQALKAYETQIDDQIKQGRYDFFELSHQILAKRTEEAKTYYTEILAKPFDFDVDETIELDEEKIEFANSKAELRDNWRKALKHQVLTRLVTQLEVQEKVKQNPDSVKEKIKSFTELEAESREKVLKSNDEWFKRLEKLERNDRLAVYLNTFAEEFDPHTNFLPPAEKANFNISLSGRLEGIGATLQEKDGYIKVVAIVPGSASYRQGDLKVGDLILKVAQGDAEPVDVVDMRLDHAVELVRGKKGTEVRLTVQRIDGTTKVIPIIRDVVILEETYAKSAVVTGKKIGNKVGYIKLPKFYADFNGTGGRNCSQDVEIEIRKLLAEKVDGIILDLRDNGGGSLQDVVQMAGLFIEKGPIVQVKSRNMRPQVLMDRDSRIQYDGPLVVMVNSLSASASEIFAAAMQDYNRGIVVGSVSTFGKGTVQRFIDLDEYLTMETASLKPLGSLKITTQKFYRVNGGATQLKGVNPDIVLPDNYMYIEFGEKEQDFAMPWDEIAPSQYNKWMQLGSFKNKLIDNSKKRIKDNEVFNLVEQNAKRLKSQRDRTLVSIKVDEFRKAKQKDEEEAKRFDELFKPIDDLMANPLADDVKANTADTTFKARTDAWMLQLKKDPYLYEAALIVKDWNKLK